MFRIVERGFVAAGALTVALGTVACGGGTTEGPAQDPDREASAGAPRAETGEQRAGPQPGARQVNLIGCLQEGPGTAAFILTQANVSSPVGTAGSESSAERQQMAAAIKSYRLEGDRGKMEELVGKQVRVIGQVTEESDVAHAQTPDANRNRTAGETGATGTATDREPPKGSVSGDRGPMNIGAGDLARVDVQSVEKVAEVCGSQSSNRSQ